MNGRSPYAEKKRTKMPPAATGGESTKSLMEVHATAESRAEEPDRPWFWVSVLPSFRGDERRDATDWTIFINLKALPGEDVDRHCLKRLRIETGLKGFGALPEIDKAIADIGYQRVTSWELGSDKGFVAWITPEELA